MLDVVLAASAAHRDALVRAWTGEARARHHGTAPGETGPESAPVWADATLSCPCCTGALTFRRWLAGQRHARHVLVPLARAEHAAALIDGLRPVPRAGGIGSAGPGSAGIGPTGIGSAGLASAGIGRAVRIGRIIAVANGAVTGAANGAADGDDGIAQIATTLLERRGDGDDGGYGGGGDCDDGRDAPPAARQRARPDDDVVHLLGTPEPDGRWAAALGPDWHARTVPALAEPPGAPAALQERPGPDAHPGVDAVRAPDAPATTLLAGGWPASAVFDRRRFVEWARSWQQHARRHADAGGWVEVHLWLRTARDTYAWHWRADATPGDAAQPPHAHDGPFPGESGTGPAGEGPAPTLWRLDSRYLLRTTRQPDRAASDWRTMIGPLAGTDGH